MIDLTFSYSGRELAPLLERRVAQHIADLSAAEEQLARFTLGQIEAAKAPSSMKIALGYDSKGNLQRKPAQTTGNDVAAALHAREQAYIAKREDELWLLECLRTPKIRWQLTLAHLALLYPEQTARETLASLQAKRSGPSSPVGRLLGWLATWLSPRRQVPRLPASAA